jgi:hypothetical protein
VLLLLAWRLSARAQLFPAALKRSDLLDVLYAGMEMHTGLLLTVLLLLLLLLLLLPGGVSLMLSWRLLGSGSSTQCCAVTSQQQQVRQHCLRHIVGEPHVGSPPFQMACTTQRETCNCCNARTGGGVARDLR